MKKLIPADSVLVPDQARRVFEGKIFDVYQWPQELFDGSTHTFEMLKRTDTVNALCVVDGKILVLDDEQPHLGKRRSLPGGRIDPEDSTAQAAAEREILEETGYRFNNWKLVKVIQPYRKIEWFVYTFVAWDVADQQTPHLDPGEKISLQQLELNELKQQVDDDMDYLGEQRDLLKAVTDVDGLLALPEFQGQEVDR